MAALAGSRTLSLDWSPAVSLGAVALGGLAVAALATSALLRHDAIRPLNDATSATKTRQRTPRPIWMLAALALMIMLCEGVANDWSTLHLRQVLDATAALAHKSFATAMTVGRLRADRATARLSPVAVLRYGASVAALGLTAAALSPWIPLTLAGWAVFGAGLSGCVPQLLSAAGHCRRSWRPSALTGQPISADVCAP